MNADEKTTWYTYEFSTLNGGRYDARDEEEAWDMWAREHGFMGVEHAAKVFGEWGTEWPRCELVAQD